jgi:hypothetical protein
MKLDTFSGRTYSFHARLGSIIEHNVILIFPATDILHDARNLRSSLTMHQTSTYALDHQKNDFRVDTSTIISQ